MTTSSAGCHSSTNSADCHVRMSSAGRHLLRISAGWRILHAVALVQALLAGSSSPRCEMKLHSEELDLTAEELSVRQGMGLSLELDSAVAEIVEKQNQLVE